MNKKAKLLKGAARKSEEVYIESVDETYTIKSLSAKDLGNYIDYVKSEPGELDGIVNLISRCLLDDEGNRMFAEDEVDQLGEIDLSVLLQLADACQRVSGLDKEISETKKN